MPASTCWQCLRRGAGAPAGERLGHRRGHRGAVEPRGVEHARRRSRSRRASRPAGGAPPGTGDGLAELDALEGVRHGPARASSATRRPARGRRRSWPSATARGPVDGRLGRPVHRDAVAGTSTSPRSGSTPCTGRSVERGGRHHDGDGLVAVAGHDDGGVVPGQRGVPSPATARRAAVEPARRAPAARAAAARRRRRRVEPRPTHDTWSSADDVARAAPCSSNSSDDRGPRSRTPARRASPSSASAASSAAPVLVSVACAQAALEQLEVVALDHRSFPRSSRRRAMMLRWISALPP